jgi:hypothetical protein
VDPLVTELLTSARQVDPDIAPSVVNALAIVTESASKNMGPQVKEGLRDLIEEAEGTTGMSTDDYICPRMLDLHILIDRPLRHVHPKIEASSGGREQGRAA